MQLLEPSQIKHIEDRLAHASLKNTSLSIDILDHVCCMIEERLDLGWDYTKAENEVFSEMGVLQIQAIEQETNMLTQNKIIMKKRTKIIGLVAIFLMVVGFALKMMHLEGAAIFWTLGVLDLSFGFALFLTIDRFSYKQSNREKMIGILGYLGSASFLLGIGFKLLSWPIANNAMVIGGFVLLIYFVFNNKVAEAAE